MIYHFHHHTVELAQLKTKTLLVVQESGKYTLYSYKLQLYTSG